MEFTGERFHPELVREIWYEHYHRYCFAKPFVAGRRVLDLACGEGYGAGLLGESAGEVVGVDRSPEAVAHANARYGSERVRFLAADASALPLPDDRFDVVVSFETIEHLAAQEAMLDEFRRVLRPDGLLLLSSPDRKTYSEDRGYHNEHHVRELYRAELEALLTPRFPALRLLGQRLLFASVIWDPHDASGPVQRAAFDRAAGRSVAWPLAPLYWIALCAADQAILAAHRVTDSLFVDPEESVYRHYDAEVRRNMAAGGIIAERDRRIVALERRLAELEAALSGHTKAAGKEGGDSGLRR